MTTRLKDIAEKLNISLSTVSKALSNHPKISTKTKEKVLNITRELNYQPNLIARSLKLKKTKTIGIIIGDITNPFYAEILKGSENIANLNGMSIILCNSDYNYDKELEYINVLMAKKVDGILLTPSSNRNSLEFLRKADTPFVIMDALPDPEIPHNCVYTDHYYGTYTAIKYLIDLGHTKIVLINGPSFITSCKQVELGFLKAMCENNIEVKNEYLIEGNLKIQDSFKAMEKLLKLKDNKLPTAIFINSDEAAIGVYGAIYSTGRRIPEDFSIIGYDDIPGSKYLSPPLTTISQEKNQLGILSMNILIEEINGPKNFENKIIKLTPNLVIRKSTSIIK